MGRFNIKKHSTHIDMTPMSDVMVLLLTFFMLTATFVKKEPVKVITPGSVSEIDVPDQNVLGVIIEPSGRIFMSFDKRADAMTTLDYMSEKYPVLEALSREDKSEFGHMDAFGVPISQLKSLLSIPARERDAVMTGASNIGIPCDSINNEFKDWVQCAKEANSDLRVSIKADATTPYKVIKQVMTSLQDIKENRYNLITNLKKVETK